MQENFWMSFHHSPSVSFLNLFRNSERKKKEKKINNTGVKFSSALVIDRNNSRACTTCPTCFNLHGEWWYTTRLIGTSMLPIKPTTIFSTKSRKVSIVFASSFSAAKSCTELVAAFSTPGRKNQTLVRYSLKIIITI